MPHDAFISYSKANRETTEAICQELEKSNIHVWLAPRDVRPDVGWAQSIIEAVQSARVFVLVLSLDSNASKEVRREVVNAAANDITIIPFEIELVDKKLALDPTLSYYINELHWVDGKTPPFGKRVQNLVRRIDNCLNQTAVSPRQDFEKDEGEEALREQISQADGTFDKDKLGGPEIPRELRVKILKLMGYAFKELYHRQMNYSGLYRNPCDAIVDRFEYQTGHFVGGADCAHKIQNLVCWSETNDLLGVTLAFLNELVRYPSINIVLEFDLVAETNRIFKERKIRYSFIQTGTGKVELTQVPTYLEKQETKAGRERKQIATILSQIRNSALSEKTTDTLEIDCEKSLFGKSRAFRADLYWKFKIGTKVHELILELKGSDRPTDSRTVLILSSILSDLPSRPIGIIVAKSFNRHAVELAKKEGILIYNIGRDASITEATARDIISLVLSGIAS